MPADAIKMSLGNLGPTANQAFMPLFSMFGDNTKKVSLGASKAIIKGDSNFPDNFDSRVQWPGCIQGVRNQGNCGSCWAFSSSGFLSDRLCIHSEGQVNVTLAPQDMVSCDFENYGCSGGFLSASVDFLETEGVASESCMPY